MLKRYIFISTLIHSLIAGFILLNFIRQVDPVVLNEKKSSNLLNIELIEPIDNEEGAESKIEDDRKFYYGIGVSINNYIDPISGAAILKVSAVYKGYSAYNSDIRIGDYILKLNDQDIFDQNDIKGEKEGPIKLTILRNGVIIEKVLNRVKVYF